jgi:hypothetical protein
MGRLVSRLVFDHLISWFDREATISSSRPNFGWPLRSGGKPVLRTGFYDDTEGSPPSGANFAPQTCIRLIRDHASVATATSWSAI